MSRRGNVKTRWRRTARYFALERNSQMGCAGSGRILSGGGQRQQMWSARLGGGNPPGPSFQIHVFPSRGEELGAARSQQQAERKIRAPVFAWLLL